MRVARTYGTSNEGIDNIEVLLAVLSVRLKEQKTALVVPIVEATRRTLFKIRNAVAEYDASKKGQPGLFNYLRNRKRRSVLKAKIRVLEDQIQHWVSAAIQFFGGDKLLENFRVA